MILSRTTEYALSVLAFMATRNRKMYAAELLYQELQIPRQYLRRLLTDLSRKGFIVSTRGRNGGFVFARDMSTINFAQVIDAMEGEEAMNTCLLGFTACILDHPCAMHDMWTEARSKMIEKVPEGHCDGLPLTCRVTCHVSQK
ncbi:MAG: Rrf2 family transcriptional regulator [Bacteroidetes bacterium]|nr:Rrf2 family transcriptional regulator [Bacteroidota bacterium]